MVLGTVQLLLDLTIAMINTQKDLTAKHCRLDLLCKQSFMLRFRSVYKRAAFTMADPLEEIIKAMEQLQTGQVRVLQQARR